VGGNIRYMQEAIYFTESVGLDMHDRHRRLPHRGRQRSIRRNGAPLAVRGEVYMQDWLIVLPSIDNAFKQGIDYFASIIFEHDTLCSTSAVVPVTCASVPRNFGQWKMVLLQDACTLRQTQNNSPQLVPRETSLHVLV
jgi:hypothetical protein